MSNSVLSPPFSQEFNIIPLSSSSESASYFMFLATPAPKCIKILLFLTHSLRVLCLDLAKQTQILLVYASSSYVVTDTFWSWSFRLLLEQKKKLFVVRSASLPTSLPFSPPMAVFNSTFCKFNYSFSSWTMMPVVMHWSHFEFCTSKAKDTFIDYSLSSLCRCNLNILSTQLPYSLHVSLGWGPLQERRQNGTVEI